MAYWLFKEEPDHYSYEQLERDGRTTWDGVENALALQHLRKVKEGDQIFYYHTGKVKAVVGIMTAATSAYRDPAAADERHVVVDVVPRRRLPQLVTLRSIKSHPSLAGWDLVRLSRLSIVPVTPTQWKVVLALSLGEPAA